MKLGRRSNKLSLIGMRIIVLGEANGAQKLGYVYLQQGQLEAAELSLNHALLLHRQCHAPSNEAIDLRLLE